MNMQTPRLSESQVFERLNSVDQTSKANVGRVYYAMYSSWLQGIVTNPNFMLLPLDDHMVHRGDGVFEAIKLVSGGIYLLDEHIQRLFVSAAALGLGAELNPQMIRDVVINTARVAFEVFAENKPQAKSSDFSAIIRLFLSRGQGSFSPNPYDTQGNQLYCVVTEYKAFEKLKYKTGVSIGKSHIPVKESWFPTVKSCNYLTNVLMKKESVDRKLDFTVSFTDAGFLAESATENIFLLDKSMRLVHPRWNTILKGTMLVRIFELATQHQWLPIQGPADVSESDLMAAQGIFMAGTTLDIIPVSNYEGMKIPIATIYEKILSALQEDQRPGSDKITQL